MNMFRLVRLVAALLPFSGAVSLLHAQSPTLSNLSTRAQIGTGGNINRIFKENGNAFGEPLSRVDIQRQRDRIAAYSFEDRVKLLRLRPDRADVVIPAADIFLRILACAEIEEVFVPKVGLADGIVYDLYMKQHGHVRYPRSEYVPA